MEPIILSSVPNEKFQKTCYLCEEHGRESKTSAGACMQCNKIGCRQAFHVTCAQNAKLLCEEQQGVSANTVKYVGYCSYHWNKKGKGVVVPRASERARSKAEGRTQHVLKPDISKRPSVIGTTKSTESTSPTSSSAKPKNRKPSFKTSDTFPESLSASDSSNLLGSQHLMKTQKITSPLNTPSVRDHLSNYSSVVSTPFLFFSQLPIRKPDTPSIGQAVSNGVSNTVLPKSSAAVTQAESSKEIWKSPPTQTTAKKSEEAVNTTKTVSNSETKNTEAKNSEAKNGEAKNSNESSSSITKKRKNNKASSADEDGKKKQKTNSNHEKKSSYSLGAVGKGKGKTPILQPSPFVSKSSSSSSVREMEIPTKLDDFLEFQWKQGVEFLSHQPGYLDGELIHI
ncbi:AF-10 isoform X4 [Paramuricea clavata]|uniref:AF-10 isoform X4 n=1 Tax=Paramuricea clavata TaxID=317549 RepID=A0A6S7IP51_PARCT|nr:AF-10 isoform X4 [Paramuricea clavata]